MTTPRPGPLHGRRAASLVLGLFVAAGLVVIFAGTLARSTDVEAEAERLRAEIAALEARKLAGDQELRLFGTDAFKSWEARAHGYGEKGELPFSLTENAPSPEPIVPIGSSVADGGRTAPFDAWMDLLFGA